MSICESNNSDDGSCKPFICKQTNMDCIAFYRPLYEIRVFLF